MLKFLEMRKANKLIQQQIKELETDEEPDLSYVGDVDILKTEELKEYIQKMDEIKNRLEAKSQYSLVGITLSITLILGLTSTLSDYSSTNIFVGGILILLSISCKCFKSRRPIKT